MSTISKVYTIISIVSFSAAGILVAIAVFLWFKFKIRKIIFDLSGLTEKRSIKNAAYNRKNSVNSNIADSLMKAKNMSDSLDNITEPLNDDTALLNETELLTDDENETVLLADDAAPNVSISTNKLQNHTSSNENIQFKIIDDVEFYSSTEDI